MPGGVTQYILRGGPCDGKTGELTPEIAQSGQLQCGGHIYKITSPVQVSGGREVFRDAGKVPPPPSPPKAARAHGGWHDVRRSVNQRMPAALRQSQHSMEAALRELSRGRKVRL